MKAAQVMQQPNLCGAKLRQSPGRTCRHEAGWGTDHQGVGRCKLHGGKTRNQRVAAARQQAAQLARVFGDSIEISPEDALFQELARSNGIVAWLAGKVAELDEAEATGPVGNPDHHNRAEPHVWIRLLADERDRLTRTAKLCIDAGLDERRVRAAEQLGSMIAAVIGGVLADLGVADDPRAPQVVRRHLTMIDTTGREIAA